MIFNKSILVALIYGAFFISCGGRQGGHELPVLNVIPAPRISIPFKGAFTLTERVLITYHPDFEPEAHFLSDWLSACGVTADLSDSGIFSRADGIQLIKRKGNPESEAYGLFVGKDFIHIKASARRGIFHGITTLRQLLPPAAEQQNQLKLPSIIGAVAIEDEPRFPHRGLLLDCCRHFMQPQFVKRIIDLLAYHKMNVLHWHLTEDQGWRIQIEAFPELTRIGAQRKNQEGEQYGGYYTTSDIREIVAYAAERHITVIPEIEMPGHALAALASYPHLSCKGDSLEVTSEWGVFKDIYCAGNDSVFVFLEKVLDEVCVLFPSEYVHIGGDEAPKVRWDSCPKCRKRIANEGLKNSHELQSWFIGRIGQYLRGKGKKIIGWDEILEGGLPEGAAIQSWRGFEGGLQAARFGSRAVMSPTSHCYFDYDISTIDMAKVYAFDPIPAGLEAKYIDNIIGGECNMWTERAPQQTVESKILPRLSALAEVLWTYPAQRDFLAFQKRMEKHYERLDAMGVSYGAEGPSAIIKTNFECGKVTVQALALTSDVQLELSTSGNPPWQTLDSMGLLPSVTERGQTVTYILRALRKGKNYGDPLSISLCNHIAIGCPVAIGHSIAEQYAAGGPGALTDGILGASDRYNDGRWQGTFGQDIAVEIVLPRPVFISQLSTRFFQYINSWIFLPAEAEFWTVSDGERPVFAGSVYPKASQLQRGSFSESLSIELKTPRKVKKVILKARNPGPCPEWHDAAGQPTWLFFDELVVN